MSLSTHVLDAVTGRPAVDVAVTLFDADGTVLAEDATNDDGRVPALGEHLDAGVYRLRFDTATYFTSQGITGFYPEVVIAFEITDPTRHHHVPVLLSPYAYSTYRGS